MVLSILIGDKQWTKFRPLLWLALISLWIQKLSVDMCVFPSQVLVLTNIFVPLNYASIIIEYNQRMQSYFGGQTWGLHILINNTAKMMCYCYETIIIGHTCVENNRSWPDWLVWKGVKSEKASRRKIKSFKMRCSSDMYAELEDNPINSWECCKCKRVSHHIWSNNMEALYLQRDIPPSTVYFVQYCMMSMEQVTTIDVNEEIVAIKSIIEV